MKKSRPRNRSRSLPGAAGTPPAGVQELDPRANGDPQLSVALQSFEALTVGNQLQFLAVVLRDEIGRRAGGPSAQRAGLHQESDPRPPAPPGLPAPELAPDLAPELAVAELQAPADTAPLRTGAPDAVAEHSLEESPATLASPATPVPAAVLAVPATPPPTAALAPRAALALRATPARPSTALAKWEIVESDEFAQYGKRNFPLPVRMSDLRGRAAAAARPANFNTLPIIMTMVCSFLVTFGVMLWQRQGDASASQNPSPSLERPLPATMPPATPPAPMRTLRRAVQPSQRLEQPPPPLVPANAPQNHADPANELPVELSFRRRPVGNEGEHAGRVAWNLTGRIHNLSEEALEVDVSVEGEQGPSYARVLIDPDSDAEFGSNDGLEIHPNDRITLHSAPYSDVVSQVR